MAGNVPDRVAANLCWEGDCDGPQMNVDVVDCIRDIDISLESVSKSELDNGHIAPTVKTANRGPINHPSPVESTEDGVKKVPTMKISGLSSELQENWGCQHVKDEILKQKIH